ncbi:MAG: hypothetical protein HY268_21230 [Deltaproteobacteria bacterium]|nr:hypothetical protein [Deltaproteobacteria bacterium]
MKIMGLILLIGGWLIAVAGLLITDATGMRMIMALVGFGTTIAGLMTVNKGHTAHAIWKGRGGLA